MCQGKLGITYKCSHFLNVYVFCSLVFSFFFHFYWCKSQPMPFREYSQQTFLQDIHLEKLTTEANSERYCFDEATNGCLPKSGKCVLTTRPTNHSTDYDNVLKDFIVSSFSLLLTFLPIQYSGAVQQPFWRGERLKIKKITNIKRS